MNNQTFSIKPKITIYTSFTEMEEDRIVNTCKTNVRSRLVDTVERIRRIYAAKYEGEIQKIRKLYFK